MPRESKEIYRLLRQLGLLSMIPMLLVSGPLAGYFVGKLLVQKFHTHNVWALILVAIGFLGSAMESYRIIQKVSRESK